MATIREHQIDVLSQLRKEGKDTPLDFMLKIMHGTDIDGAIRLEAAHKAAPYVHKKQPLDMQHSGAVNIIPPFVPSRSDIMDQDEDFDTTKALDEF